MLEAAVRDLDHPLRTRPWPIPPYRPSTQIRSSTSAAADPLARYVAHTRRAGRRSRAMRAISTIASTKKN
jgi:hypothetical protein